jgi:hypothetical protein
LSPREDDRHRDQDEGAGKYVADGDAVGLDNDKQGGAFDRFVDEHPHDGDDDEHDRGGDPGTTHSQRCPSRRGRRACSVSGTGHVSL